MLFFFVAEDKSIKFAMTIFSSDHGNEIITDHALIALSADAVTWSYWTHFIVSVLEEWKFIFQICRGSEENLN